MNSYSPRIDQSIGNEDFAFLCQETGNLDGRLAGIGPEDVPRDPIDRQTLGTANFRDECLRYRSVVR